MKVIGQAAVRPLLSAVFDLWPLRVNNLYMYLEYTLSTQQLPAYFLLAKLVKARVD